MRIIGIDPGYAIVGYGIVDYDCGSFSTVAFGAVTTKAHTDFTKRLSIIYNDVTELIDTYKPEALSLEKVYFNTNTTTAIEVAEARGVILLAAEKAGVKVYEYTPLQVKQAVTGYGRAEKNQVIEMIKRLLHLRAAPKLDDTADALAMAICHGFSNGSVLGKLSKEDFK